MLKSYQYKFIKTPTPEQESARRQRMSLAYDFYNSHKEDCNLIVQKGIEEQSKGKVFNASFVTKQLRKMGYSNLGFTGRDLIRILGGYA